MVCMCKRLGVSNTLATRWTPDDLVLLVISPVLGPGKVQFLASFTLFSFLLPSSFSCSPFLLYSFSSPSFLFLLFLLLLLSPLPLANSKG